MAQPGRLRRPGRGLKTLRESVNNQFNSPPHTQKFGHSLNPRLKSRISSSDAVAFVPMAAVSADLAMTVDIGTRPYAEVAKGYTPMRNGDLLVAKITPCFENGKIAQAVLPIELGFGSTEFHVIRVDPNKVCSRYLLHFLRQQRVRSQGERRMTGSGGQRRVPLDFLAKLDVPLPPLAEQRRIAEALDRAERLRTQRRQALAQLDVLAESIFLEMFGGAERKHDLWPVVPLEQAVKAGTIVTYGIVQAGEEHAGGVPYIRTGDIVDGEIAVGSLRHTAPSIAAKFARSRVCAGDIVMSIRATVGTTAIVPPGLAGANLTQGTARIAPGSRTLGTYLLHYLRSAETQQWIQRQVKGATFREITLGRLRELPTMLPPLDMQQAFGRAIDALGDLRAKQCVAFERLDALCSSLQHRAFRGEL